MKPLPPPPPVLFTEHALLDTYPQLTMKAVKRCMLAGTFPQRVPLPRGGRGWRADEVKQAMQTRDEPDAPAGAKIGVPKGFVGIDALIGVAYISRHAAKQHRAGGPRRPRQARAGLTPFNAAELACAAAAGKFPAPIKGPWGEAWSLEEVQRWCSGSR